MQHVSQCLSTFIIPWDKPTFVQMMQICNKQPKVGLSICKFYRSRGDFGIGLDFHRLKYNAYTNLFVFDDSIARAVCQFEWKGNMFRWSFREWAYFVIKVIKKLEIHNFKINISHIMPSYKFIRCPTPNKCKQFVTKLQIEFDKFYRHKTIKFVVDGSLYTDCALGFDTDPSNIYSKLCQSVGFNIDQTPKLKPALTYLVENQHKIVIDYYGKIYSSEDKYFMYRLFRGKKYCCVQHLNEANFIIQMCKLTHKKCNNVYEKYKELTKFMRKEGMHNLMDKFYRENKNCKVCGKYDSNSVFVCKCGNLFVCGRKCHKIAWVKKGHREICTERIMF
eukprot:400473_1